MKNVLNTPTLIWISVFALSGLSCATTADRTPIAVYYGPIPEKELTKASESEEQDLMELAESFKRPYDYYSKNTLKVKFYDSLDNLVYEDSISPGERKSEALIQMLHRSDYLTNWERQAFFRVYP